MSNWCFIWEIWSWFKVNKNIQYDGLIFSGGVKIHPNLFIIYFFFIYGFIFFIMSFYEWFDLYQYFGGQFDTDGTPETFFFEKKFF